jgi:hypothetical protein
VKRREFLRAAGLGGACVLIGGGLWVRRAYARSKLATRLMADAMPALTEKAHTELVELPARARDEIRTWFHGPCINSNEFVYDLCSPAFAEKLAACRTAELKEECFVTAFVSKVVSETEILNRVQLIASDVGNDLDRNWANCCKTIASKWNVYIKEYGSSDLTGITQRVEPMIKSSIQQTIQVALLAGQRPAISQTLGNVGKSAILVLPLARLPQLAIPLFVVLAIRHLFDYVMGLINNKVRDYQRAISEHLAHLGHRIGEEFYTEVKARLACLHGWQEDALRMFAESQAEESIGVL